MPDHRGEAEQASRAVRRAVAWAAVSGGTLVFLGCISLLVSLVGPLSAGTLISIAVIGNGVVEWRWAMRLAAHHPRAPSLLAANQLFLGGEIAVYAAWQAWTMQGDAVLALLDRPLVRAFLRALEPEVVQVLVSVLPDAVRWLYALVGAVALVGCAATALFYLSRRKYLAGQS
jgi:hypothetical protein